LSYIDKTCPGITKFMRPIPEYFKCPNCGGEVEIWSDEETGKCSKCGGKYPRPEKEKSCLEWCQYADNCKEIIREAKSQRGQT